MSLFLTGFRRDVAYVGALGLFDNRIRGTRLDSNGGSKTTTCVELLWGGMLFLQYIARQWHYLVDTDVYS